MSPCDILSYSTTLSFCGHGSRALMSLPIAKSTLVYLIICGLLILLTSIALICLLTESSSARGVTFFALSHDFFTSSTCAAWCITARSEEFLSVTFGIVGLVGPQGRFTDVVLPGQSYLSGVPDSTPFCSRDSNLSKFSLLASDFGRTAFAPTYDPWDYVGTFGRSKIYKALLSSSKVAVAGPQGNVVSLDPREASLLQSRNSLPCKFRVVQREGEWVVQSLGQPVHLSSLFLCPQLLKTNMYISVYVH